MLVTSAALYVRLFVFNLGHLPIFQIERHASQQIVDARGHGLGRVFIDGRGRRRRGDYRRRKGRWRDGWPAQAKRIPASKRRSDQEHGGNSFHSISLFVGKPCYTCSKFPL